MEIGKCPGYLLLAAQELSSGQNFRWVEEGPVHFHGEPGAAGSSLGKEELLDRGAQL